LAAAKAVGGDVVDLLLAFLHARHVVGQRDVSLRGVGVRAGKAQQLGDAFLVGVVLAGAFLEHLAELASRTSRTSPCRSPARSSSMPSTRFTAAVADGLDVLRLLQDLARHVERQVVGIDHPAHEAQVGGISCSASSMMKTRRT
jgi:hypothetical protein